MTLLFGGFFEELAGEELVDAVQNVYGQERYEPGANGSAYALKLRPNGLFPIYFLK